MSITVINAAQVRRGCADFYKSPTVNSFDKNAHSWGWNVPQSRDVMLNANDSLRYCNVKLCVSVKFQL